jgi:hypothetical protein
VAYGVSLTDRDGDDVVVDSTTRINGKLDAPGARRDLDDLALIDSELLAGGFTDLEPR